MSRTVDPYVGLDFAAFSQTLCHSFNFMSPSQTEIQCQTEVTMSFYIT